MDTSLRKQLCETVLDVGSCLAQTAASSEHFWRELIIKFTGVTSGGEGQARWQGWGAVHLSNQHWQSSVRSVVPVQSGGWSRTPESRKDQASGE